MARDDAYRRAEEKIAEALRTGATELDLSCGHGAEDSEKLTELPESLAALTQLQTLNLWGNQLTALPESRGQLTKLQTLNLSYNQLTALPESLGQLTQLQTLDLSHNQLTALPEWLGQLTQLQTLDLWGNQLTALPESLGQLTQLQTLNLWGNQLTALPESVLHLRKLETLWLGAARLGNPLRWLPSNLNELKQLRTLGAAACQLKELPEWIGEMAYLTRLHLETNALTDLPQSLIELSKLEILDLGNNPLNPELAAANEQGLDAVKEYLRAKAEASVVLNEAKLILIGEGEVGKSCLLDALRDEPWQEHERTHGIRLEQVEVPMPNLDDRHSERSEESPEAGEILRSAQDDKDRQDDKARSGGTTITLNGWDFGGQRVYRPTHQLFFSSPAVYLVVWKPREGLKAGQVPEWIKLIKHREPDAKVLVVATHGGPKQTQPDIDEYELVSQFGRDTLVGFHKVDSLPINYDKKKKKTWTGPRPGIPELRDAIAKVAASLPEMGREVPARWQRVRSRLEQCEQSWMHWDDFFRFCTQGDASDGSRIRKNSGDAGQGDDRSLATPATTSDDDTIEPGQVDLFAKLSHTLGHLIHYDYDNDLREIVILKPDWLATAISFVLDDDETREKHGLVSFARLSQLWNDPQREPDGRYPEELHPTFRRLMERFDLSYPVVLEPSRDAEPDTCLIAQLVDEVRPELPDWGAEPDPGVFEQQQVCKIIDDNNESAAAEGLFFQLIVRFHKYSLGRWNHSDSIHWKRGLMLEHEYNGRALLEHIGNNVRITVRAPYPGHFLSVLTEHINSLVESFWEGLNCEIMVPCLGKCRRKNNPSGLLAVRILIDSRRQGQDKQPCPICNEWQDIDGLLLNSPITAQADAIGAAAFDDVMAELQAIHAELSTLGRQELNRFRALNNLQRRRVSQVDEQFENLMRTLTDEAKDGPRLFSLEARKPKGLINRIRKAGQETYRLTLWCEHARLPLTALNTGGEPDGFYDIQIPNKWLVGAASFLSKLNTTLSLVLPIAASGAKLLLSDSDYKRIGEQLEFNKTVISSLVSGGNTVGSLMAAGDSAESQFNVEGDDRRGEGVQADGVMLRQLHAFLEEQDPNKEYGGLVRVPKKSGGFVWVHPQFVTEY